MRLYIHELGYPSLTISMKISLIPCKLILIPLVPSKYTMKLYTTSNTNCNLNPLQTESRSEDGTEQRMRTLGEIWETGNFIVLKTFTAFQVRSLVFQSPTSNWLCSLSFILILEFLDVAIVAIYLDQLNSWRDVCHIFVTSIPHSVAAAVNSFSSPACW